MGLGPMATLPPELALRPKEWPSANLVHCQTDLEMVWPNLEMVKAWTSGEDARSADGTRGVWAKL